jgi:hypothetical protein
MVERPWLKHYEPGLPPTLRPYPDGTLLDVVSDTVRQRPGHTALIFKGTHLSYARLEQLTNAFGAALVAQGVKHGDRVATLGGVDIDRLCRLPEDQLRAHTRKIIEECLPGGRFALGSGNTVCNYVPLRSYFAMVEEAVNF